MSWWGKVIGGAFGFMLGGPLGAILGAALGHNFDKGMGGLSDHDGFSQGQQERVQTAFFTATFSVMGHVCKADGRVCENEIAVAKRVMAEMVLSPEQKKAAMALFSEGKKDGFPLEDVLQQLRREIGFRRNLQRMFMEIQCYAAYADGVVHPAEKKLLLQVCRLFGFSEYEFESLLAAVGAGFHQRSRQTRGKPGTTLKDAYAILNVSAKASNDEIKKAYRRLLSQHHPDKLVSKGLPEEMMKMAAERTHEIRQAYEQIKEARGF